MNYQNYSTPQIHFGLAANENYSNMTSQQADQTYQQHASNIIRATAENK
jgi:hypothetical protein